MTEVAMNYVSIKQKLEEVGQLHLLQFYDDLTEVERKALITQIEAIDFAIIEQGKKQLEHQEKGIISPLAVRTIEEIAENRDKYLELGNQAIKEQKVAAVLLAGGMGTRLGSDDPKGAFNVGITRELYIFECLIHNLLEVVEGAGSYVPLFIMTSDKNDEATRSFLEKHQYFGYPKESIYFFLQEMVPATDYEGKVYLEEKDRLATSPNGNGGWYASMETAGLLKKTKEMGIEWFNVFAVDNVLQRIADPIFVGATIDAKVATGAKVIRKNAKDEKIGVICLEDQLPSVVEYYELTDEMMESRDANGDLIYNYGVILNYLISYRELENLANQEMPLHVVEKKIPYLNQDGNYVNPEKANGYKYETLVLDMVKSLETCLPFEVSREKEFAPIKNKTGVDSVDSARVLLEKNGIIL